MISTTARKLDRELQDEHSFEVSGGAGAPAVVVNKTMAPNVQFTGRWLAL